MDILGHDIPRLGMGCWAIGGEFYLGEQPLGFANVNDKDATATIHAAMDAGIRLFDTAAVYGAGHSERLLGKALMDRPDALIISKLGMGFDEQSKQVTEDVTDHRLVAPAIEKSLERLQRDRIDIMLLHLNELDIALAAPIFEAMEVARQEGKIRSYGWSTDFPASVDAISSMDGFVAVEHAMNVFHDAPSMRATLDTHNLLPLIRSPLAMGILTGKFSASSTLPKNDNRADNHAWREYFWDGKVAPDYLASLNRVRELLCSEGRTLTQGALCWLLAKSDRCVPIPGARTAKQMQENAQAAELGPLPTSVMAEIEQAINREPEGDPRPR